MLAAALLLCAAPVRSDFVDGDSADAAVQWIQPRYPSLRDRFDPALQHDLEVALARAGLARAAARGKLAVALVDITSVSQPRVAAVNGDQMIYAASLPKIAILLGAFVQAERGRLVLDRETRGALTRMIRNSSNADATAMLARVGRNELAEILQSDRYRLYDRAYNGGLSVGKDYGKSPAFRRDPLHNLSHGATALQAARFYYMLETGQLANPAHTREMKQMLGNPGIHHKFVKGLEGRPDVRIYRKSGTWRQWHSDSAIVERPGSKYIIVALVESVHGGRWLTHLAQRVDDLMQRTRIAFGDGAADRATPPAQVASLRDLEDPAGTRLSFGRIGFHPFSIGSSFLPSSAPH